VKNERCHEHLRIKKEHKIEIADIFRNNLNKLSAVSKDQWKVVNSIISCRTSKLGGHVLKCDACAHEEYSYNSCRNRHCPKCQTLKKVRWLEAREKELLPVNYFHVVFTIPSNLNPLTLQNKKTVYNILFRAVKETLIEAAKTKRNLGADIGLIGILHTWGQNLLDHPHIHCVIPAGGISASGNNWISCRNNYFISVKILSKLFQSKFLDYLKKAFNSNELTFFGKIKHLSTRSDFQKVIDIAYSTDWVVYAKKPFTGAKQVFDYIARYTHRVAISNNRILKMENSTVSFSWKDYSDDNKQKIMTLDTPEFMRRFLLHVLPDGFVKIRFFGFLANKVKNQKLEQIFKIFGKKKPLKAEEESWSELLLRITGINVTVGPVCNKGNLIIIKDIKPTKGFDNSS
jgi:hypothetical protein